MQPAGARLKLHALASLEIAPSTAYPHPGDRALPQEPRPHRQAGCPSIEGRCDKLLGPKACLQLRGLRNGAEAAGAVLGSLAVLLLTISAGVGASRHALLHLRRRRGWRRLEAIAAKHPTPESQV